MGIPWSLPLDRFIKWAAKEIRSEAVEGGEWKSRLWEFTRLIRSRFAEGIKADRAFREVDKVICKQGGWESFCELSRDEAHAEFVATWPKIRFLVEEDPLQQALLKARAHPVKAPAREGRDYPTPGYDRFISFVGWLQVTMGPKPVFLPCKRIAQVLETTPRMISLWRQIAIEDGFIEVLTGHRFSSKGFSKATEFKVNEGFRAWFEEQLKKRIG